MNGIVDESIDQYLDDLTKQQTDHPVLEEMEQRARRMDFPFVGRPVGRFLELQARAVGARRVVELGSGFGYSAFWFAHAVGPAGEVVCSDFEPDHAEMAREFLTHADLWDRVRFEVGDAADVLTTVGGDVDVVFCDADKQGYPEHWRNACERIRVGGLYIADNALWHGRAATGEPTPDHPGWTEAVQEHNRLVADDPRYISSLLPLRDGVLVALRVE